MGADGRGANLSGAAPETTIVLANKTTGLMFVRVSADEPIAIGHPHVGQSLGIHHVVVANDFV